jgi:hypothetical protein
MYIAISVPERETLPSLTAEVSLWHGWVVFEVGREGREQGREMVYRQTYGIGGQYERFSSTEEEKSDVTVWSACKELLSVF